MSGVLRSKRYAITSEDCLFCALQIEHYITSHFFMMRANAYFAEQKVLENAQNS